MDSDSDRSCSCIHVQFRLIQIGRYHLTRTTLISCSAVDSGAWICKTSHLVGILRYQARKRTSPRSDTTCPSNASEQSSYFDSRMGKHTEQIVLTNSTIDCRSIDEIGRFLRAQYRTDCLAMAFLRCSQRIFRSQSYLSSPTESNSTTQDIPKHYSSQKPILSNTY